MGKKSQKSGLSGAYTLGGKKFAAISAVEGLRLSRSGQARIDNARAHGLSQDERRQEILKVYSLQKAR